MEFEKITELIKAVSDSSLTNFSYEEGNIKISMKTDKCQKVVTATVREKVLDSTGVSFPEKISESAKPEAPVPSGEAGNIIKSPLVGTFYNAATPESDPYVKVGDTVKKGQTLGIIEAMKLMNEIECEYDGILESVLAENEATVEYGQPLFRIK